MEEQDAIAAAHREITRSYAGEWTNERVAAHGRLHGLTGGQLCGRIERISRQRVWSATFDPIVIDGISIPFGQCAVDGLLTGKVRHPGWAIQRCADSVKHRWPERDILLVDHGVRLVSGRQRSLLTFSAVIDGVTVEATALASSWNAGRDSFRRALSRSVVADLPGDDLDPTGLDDRCIDLP